jgi:hypothetical protein
VVYIIKDIRFSSQEVLPSNSHGGIMTVSDLQIGIENLKTGEKLNFNCVWHSGKTSILEENIIVEKI